MADAKTPTGKPTFGGPQDALGRYLRNNQGARYGPGTPGVEKAGFGNAEANLNPTIWGLPPGEYGPDFSAGVARAGGPKGEGGFGENPADFAPDWYKAFFGNYGLPADVQGNILDILRKYAADPSTAQALSQQYLRGTPWFQTTYPGFANGVNNGLFTDETGYRDYLNSINGVYNQYMGRHVSGDETKALLTEGVAPQTVANRFQGQAYVNANQNDIQYLSGAFSNGQMNKDQLTALGNESAGIDTQMGQIQQKVLQKAQQVYSKLFEGQVGTPNLSLGANGLAAPGLLGTQTRPDVAA